MYNPLRTVLTRCIEAASALCNTFSDLQLSQSVARRNFIVAKQTCPVTIRARTISIAYRKAPYANEVIYCQFIPVTLRSKETSFARVLLNFENGGAAYLSDVDMETIDSSIRDTIPTGVIDKETFTKAVFPVWESHGFSLTAKAGNGALMRMRGNLNEMIANSGNKMAIKRNVSGTELVKVHNRFVYMQKSLKDCHWERLQQTGAQIHFKNFVPSIRFHETTRASLIEKSMRPYAVQKYELCVSPVEEDKSSYSTIESEQLDMLSAFDKDEERDCKMSYFRYRRMLVKS